MIYDNSKYFSCYSPNLKKYLEGNGFEIINSFINFKTEKICWIFEKTDELSKFLTIWTNNKIHS